MPHLDVSFFKKTFTCFSGMNIYENILFLYENWHRVL